MLTSNDMWGLTIIAGILVPLFIRTLLRGCPTEGKQTIKIVRIPTFDAETEINGVFEIHVSIKITGDYIKLLNYCKDRSNIKPILAGSSKRACGSHSQGENFDGVNNQYMISHYTRKTSVSDAVVKAKEIAEEMRAYGMTIVRIKVEAQNITGTTGLPVSNDDFMLCKNKYLNPYFEFHIKISNAEDYENIQVSQYSSENVKVNVSFNLFSKNMLPLLTIRAYNIGFMEAQEKKDQILDAIKGKYAFSFSECIPSFVLVSLVILPFLILPSKDDIKIVLYL